MKKNRVIIGSLILSALLISGCKDHKKKTNKPDNTTNTYTQEQGGTITLGTDIVITGAPSGLGASAKAADNTKLTEVDGNITQAKELTFVNLNKDTEIELTLKINEISKSILKSESGSATIGTYVIAQYINNSWKEIGYLYPSTATELKAKITLAQNTAGTMVVAVREKAEPLAITSGNPSTGFTPAGNLISEAIRTGTSVDAALYPSFNILGDKSIDFHWTDAFIGVLYKFTDNKVVIGEISGKDLEAFIVDRSKKYFNVDFQANNLEYRIAFNSDGSVKSKEILLNGSALEADKTYTIALDAYNFSNNKYGTITGFTKKSESELTQKELLSNYIKGLKVFPQLDGKNSSVTKEVLATDTIIASANSRTEYTEAGILMSEALRVEGGLDIMLFPSSSINVNAKGNFNKDMSDDNLNTFIDTLYSYTSNKVVKGTISGANLKTFIGERAGFKFNLDLQGGRLTYDVTFDSTGTIKTSVIKIDGIEIDDAKTYTLGIDSYQYSKYKSYNNFSNIFTEQETLGSEKELLRSYLKKGKEMLDFTAFDSTVIKEAGEIITGKKIYDIQGTAFNSPLAGDVVSGVSGVVTAVDVSGTNGSGGITGFYLQDPTGDGNNKTSDAIFVKYVNKNSNSEIKVGDIVTLNGTVEEYMSQANGLGQTQLIDVTNLKVVSSGNALPAPIVLGKDRMIPQDGISSYEGDLNTKSSLNLADGIDFYESIEGMLVKLENPIVTGVKHKYKDIYVMAQNNYDTDLKTDMGGLVIKKGDFNPEIIHIQGDTIFGDDSLTTFSPTKTEATGDVYNGDIQGIIKYDTSTYGGYFLINTKALPSFTKSGNVKEITSLTSDNNSVTIGSYNVENLYSTDEKIPDIAKSIVTNLKTPDILGLIEIQDHDGQNDGKDTGTQAEPTLTALIDEITKINPDIKYDWVNIDPEAGKDGGAPGGNIRVAFIYNTDKIEFNKYGNAGATDAGSVNADGTLNMNPVRINPTDEAFTNSRKSLAAQFTHKGTGEKITVIANHFNSKRGDSSLWGNKQPITLGSEVQRKKMATQVNNFIKDLYATGEKIVVLGDFNAFYFEEPLNITKGNEMVNLIEEKLNLDERYTYNYQGNSQTLDHMLISKNISIDNTTIDVVHINADFLDQISDHDPIVTKINLSK